MEGQNVYLCKWKKIGKKFRLWLKTEPEVSVECSDFEDGSEALAEKVARFYRDFEAVLEYDPPKPSSNHESRPPEVLVIGRNESVDAADITPDLFSGGLCSTCRKPVGNRTGESLTVIKLPKNDSAGIRNCAPGIYLLSEQFVNLLTSEEKANLQLKKISSQSVGRKHFFEVTGTPIAPFIGVKGATYSHLSCWKCPKCGSSRIYPRMPPGDLFGFSQFVCRKDLPSPNPTVFVLGGGGMSLTPCILKERWRQIVGKPGTKGVVTRSIGVIGPEMAEYDPPLPVYGKK